jgi:sugar lactone lactonase YvrE
VDSSGNVYIADSSNNRIREVTAAGTISTIAGTGTAGYTGDNGPATSAQLNGPQAVTLDASGNIYIADTGNNVIRKISGTTITTVAGNGTQCNPATSSLCGDGGAATSAKLNTPTDVKLDSSGNIYIADQADFVVREVSASSGVISNVAGSYAAGYSPTAGNSGPATSAQLNIPQAIALDSSGNIYIADTGNNIIRKVSGGTMTTAVGNGTAGYSGDGGSPGGAELSYPNGLIFDSTGTLYIDDAGNRVIRTVKF